MNLTGWAWLIVPLGVCRALQLALGDRIFEKPRAWLLRKLNPQGLPMGDPKRSYLSYLIECPWCLSMWIGLAAVGLLLWDATRAATLALLAALALSLLAVVLDRAVDRWFPDQPHPAPPPPPEQAPAHVATAFDKLAGDEHDGTS